MTLPPGEAHRLAGMVTPQEGSVVSRQLIKRSSGSVTLFAFDAGESLSEHTTPHDALVLVLEGRVDLTLDGRSLAARAGEVVLLPGGVPHAVYAPEPLVMALIMLRREGDRRSDTEG